MAKESASTAVPRLRFPEFRASRAWTPRNLIELADRKAKWSFAGGPFGSNLKASDYESSGVRVIQLQNIGDGEFLNDYKIYTSTSKADELLSCNVYSGDILLSKMGDPVGRACIVPASNGRYVMCSDGIRLAVDKEQFVCEFAFFAINFDNFRRRVEAAATGSTRKRIGLDTLKHLVIEVPAFGEQQKIADCLTSLDEVIAAQGRKVEALKAHKRGLMQQLFPREGETRPHLRFPEFRNAPEWKQATIGSRGKTFSGGTPSTADSSYYGGAIPFIRSAEIGSEVTELFLTERGLQNSSAKLVERGDVLVALYGANSGDVALAKTCGAINQAILCIRPDASKAFLYHFLTAKKAWIVATFIQGGQGNLSGEIVRSIVLQFPSFEEQQRIADCLSSLDTQIAAETHQLAALKTHKQGLMQQLFPVPRGN